jgi:hypothetical protein
MRVTGHGERKSGAAWECGSGGSSCHQSPTPMHRADSGAAVMSRPRPQALDHGRLLGESMDKNHSAMNASAGSEWMVIKDGPPC